MTPEETARAIIDLPDEDNAEVIVTGFTEEGILCDVADTKALASAYLELREAAKDVANRYWGEYPQTLKRLIAAVRDEV